METLNGCNFRYEFKADPPGTYMYHSHVGLELSDGVFGPLIVNQPLSRDPNSALYDHDCTHSPTGECQYVVLVNDWTVGEAWGDYVRARWYSGKVGMSSKICLQTQCSSDFSFQYIEFRTFLLDCSAIDIDRSCMLSIFIDPINGKCFQILI